MNNKLNIDTKENICVPIYYIKPFKNGKKIIDAEAMLMEFQDKLIKIIRKNKNV